MFTWVSILFKFKRFCFVLFFVALCVRWSVHEGLSAVLPGVWENNLPQPGGLAMLCPTHNTPPTHWSDETSRCSDLTQRNHCNPPETFITGCCSGHGCFIGGRHMAFDFSPGCQCMANTPVVHTELDIPAWTLLFWYNRKSRKSRLKHNLSELVFSQSQTINKNSVREIERN